MTIKELKKELQAVIDQQQEAAKGLQRSQNPQVIRTLLDIESRIEAFQAVLQRVQGDRIALSFFK